MGVLSDCGPKTRGGRRRKNFPVFVGGGKKSSKQRAGALCEHKTNRGTKCAGAEKRKKGDKRKQRLTQALLWVWVIDDRLAKEGAPEKELKRSQKCQ